MGLKRRRPLRGLVLEGDPIRHHGFADSPVGCMPSPLRGLCWCVIRFATTGSRTHPWLYAVTPSGFVLVGDPIRHHGFAPVALCRHPFGVFAFASDCSVTL